MVILFVCPVSLTLAEMRESLCVLVYGGKLCVLERPCCFWWDEECRFPLSESSRGNFKQKKSRRRGELKKGLKREIHEEVAHQTLHICFHFPATIPETKSEQSR